MKFEEIFDAPGLYKADSFAEGITPYSPVRMIDFNRSKIYLKKGNSVAFDYLSEEDYIIVCNGDHINNPLTPHKNEN